MTAASIPVDEVGQLRSGRHLVDWQFSDDSVESAIAVVTCSKVIPELLRWRREERQRLRRHAGGRRGKLPPIALLVAMWLAAMNSLPMNATTWRDILLCHISPRMRARLGVEKPPDPDDHHAWDAWYARVRRLFHSLFEAIDPSPEPKNRRLANDDYERALARRRDEHGLSNEILAARSERLAWFANRCLEASLSLIPADIRQQWNGSVAVDATPIPAFAQQDERDRGRGPRAQRPLITQSADPDAGLYIRTSKRDKEIVTAEDKILRPGTGFWAYEATFVVAGNDTPDEDPAFPGVVLGMSVLHKPGIVASPAMTALASVDARNYPAGWLAADRAYTNALPEEFQLAARALGYDLVLDYRKDQLGRQASYAGALLIEGGWYCPAIPNDLINATVDYRAKRINKKTWKARIEARRAYRLRPKAHPDAEAHTRLCCPASDGAPTARCELKPRSITPATRAKTRIPVTDALLAHPATVCEQQTVTFPPGEGAKLLQTLHFGSPEWQRTYNSLRNTVEGINGVAKDGAYAALGDAHRRRIRGVTAQTIITAMLLAATNLRTIRTFLAKAKPDADGTLRKPRPRRRTTRGISTWEPDVVARGGAPPP
jgi:hypothetical protein